MIISINLSSFSSEQQRQHHLGVGLYFLLILFHFHIIHHLSHPPLLPSLCRRHPCRKKAAEKEKDIMIMMTMIIIITFIHTYTERKRILFTYSSYYSSNSTCTKTPRVLVFFLFFSPFSPFIPFPRKAELCG